MEKMSRIFYISLALALMIWNASALGISSANFGDVEQGRMYNQTVTLVNSQNDFDNHFVVTVDGAIKNWVNVSPSDFVITKGSVQPITLTLKVPEDGGLGEIKGTITAEGKMTAPSSSGGGGANVGYAVATKSSIYANVKKPGALASVEITGVEVSSPVAAGSVARFTVTTKNTGNVATSANFKLDIKKDGKIVASVPGNPVDFALGEQKTVKLFWDTQGIVEGRYDAFVEATTIARGSEITASVTYKPAPVIIGGNGGKSSPSLPVPVAVILIIILAVALKRRK